MKPIKNTLEKKKRLIEETRNNSRFAPLHPSEPTDFEQWHTEVTKNFSDLALPTEIGLSVIAQLLIKDIQNPFGLVYVDVPSSGKTTLLGFFSNLEGVTLRIDNFTPASFVSHYAKKKKADLEKTDLLPLIRYRTLLLPDLAPIFSKREDDRNALLGILTRVMDGQGLETSSGAHGKRGYTGEYPFMLLGASTPISNTVWRSMGNLGPRLFFLKIGSREKTVETLADQLRYPVKKKEVACHVVTSNFIKTLWQKHPQGIDWDTNKEQQDLLEAISTLSKLLAMSRGVINQESISDGEKLSSMSERPDRINQWFYNLARGHALIQGREQIDWTDIKIVFRVMIDSIPNNRSRCLVAALRGGGVIDAEIVVSIFGYSKVYSLKLLKELVSLGVLEEVVGTNDTPGRPKKIFVIKRNLAFLYSKTMVKFLEDLIN